MRTNIKVWAKTKCYSYTELVILQSQTKFFIERRNTSSAFYAGQQQLQIKLKSEKNIYYKAYKERNQMTNRCSYKKKRAN